MSNRKVICAGCAQTFPTQRTHFYRNKRCCGLDECVKEIDRKIKHNNYKKQRRKYENGTHRRGVEPMIRAVILKRDRNLCVSCFRLEDNLQIHHIVPVSKGGNDDLSNLVALCKSCHVKVHQVGDELYVESFGKYVQEVSSISA